MSAKERVKIGQFLDHGVKLTGVIHVGTNDGYEIEFYRELGLDVIGFEPLHTGFNACYAKYKNDRDVHLFKFALGERAGVGTLFVPKGDGYGSSFLTPIAGFDSPMTHPQLAIINRFDDLAETISRYITPLTRYNGLVIDVQGMEMDVLKGFGRCLDRIDCAVIECSRKPLYIGEVPAVEVCEFMNRQGFVQINEIEDHNDVLFLRKVKNG